MDGETNIVQGAATVTATTGDVAIIATKTNVITGADTTVKADENISVKGESNVITDGALLEATKGNIDIDGSNYIAGKTTTIKAVAGDITIHDDNIITDASILAEGEEGNVSITTGAGKGTYIKNATIKGGKGVVISGDTSDGRAADKLAVITGPETVITSGGADGIGLTNVSITGTGGETATNIAANNGGNITLRERVDLHDGALTVDTGKIDVTTGSTLNVKEAGYLNGALKGDGIINKTGGDALDLDFDDTEYVGTIYVNGTKSPNADTDGSVTARDGSWIQITNKGVGADATIMMSDTDLKIKSVEGTTMETSIGTLDTSNDTAEGHLTGKGEVLDPVTGSYTGDGGNREDFTTVGSVVEVNTGVTGDTVTAKNLNLSDSTILKMDSKIAEDGSASSDLIQATGTITTNSTAYNKSTVGHPSTARVYITHEGSAEGAAEGARTTILKGNMAKEINEDVLYDMEEVNGTYQRKLQTRNMHLENFADHVDLVYSENYQSVKKTPQQQVVANVLKNLSATLDHTEGTLAASDNRLHNLMDAFDYTRSGKDARNGLQSVAGTANTVPQMMMLDSTRRHFGTLAANITLPECRRVDKGGLTPVSNFWTSYTGGYDRIHGDEYLDEYVHTSHGLTLGYDKSVNCNLRLGLAAGVQDSIGRADSMRVDANVFFLDLYASARTGKYNHRAALGIATASFDSSRHVHVEADKHSFYGTGYGDTDAVSFTLGYELSRNFVVGEGKTITPYVQVMLGLHTLDSTNETGMGEAGLHTKYDDYFQADIALGARYTYLFRGFSDHELGRAYVLGAVHAELGKDRMTAYNNFHGFHEAWKVQSMDRQPVYFELGAGVELPVAPSWTITAGGSVEYIDNRINTGGHIGVRYQF